VGAQEIKSRITTAERGKSAAAAARLAKRDSQGIAGIIAAAGASGGDSAGGAGDDMPEHMMHNVLMIQVCASANYELVRVHV
jgi:hypothetical protein